MNLLDNYSAAEFNSIPYLSEQNDEFQTRDAQRVVNSDLKELFTRYGVANRLGVSLVHRHFELKDDEAMVESNGISMPWTNPDLITMQDEDGVLIPSNWAVRQHRFMPTEFVFESHFQSLKKSPNALFSEVDPQFFEDFISTLRQHQLEHILGICLLPGMSEHQIEITREKANITTTLPEDIYRTVPGQYIDVVWGYTQSTDGIVTRDKKKCKKVSTTSSKAAHVRIVFLLSSLSQN
jgi:hypothetical protein